MESNFLTRYGTSGIDQQDQLLRVREMTRRFGAREVVRRLDLAVEPGERVALHGPNGSGKSTILRCLAGTLSPSGGGALIGGYPAGSIEARRLVGVSLSQERSFYLRLTGRANLRFFARVRGYRRKEAEMAVAALEEELELTEILAERADRCSTGMVLQLSVARALLGSPKLLLLDEPTRSLDSTAVERLWGALERRPQAAVLIATHAHDDIRRCGATLECPT